MEKHIIKLVLFLVSAVVSAQAGLSNTENYLYTKNCLDSTCVKKSENVKYFDGLGRMRQVIGIKESPTGNDLVLPVVYDESGKQTREYLPVPQSGSANGAVYQQSPGLSPYPVADPSSFYAGEKIFSEKTIESSPLSRVQQKVQIGNDWNTKPVVLGYSLNITTDKVKYFKATSVWQNGAAKNTLVDSGLYNHSQLYKSSVKDEDGNERVTFKNVRGQTILEREVISATSFADTYYVYNKYDHLAFVLPPMAASATDIGTNEVKLNSLCYQNRYDGRNRLVEKKLPGNGWEYIVYNKFDRPIMTQDANLALQGKWLFTKYDQFGRIVYTGITSNTANRQTIQANADANANLSEARSTTAFTLNGMPVYYSKVAAPTAMTQVLTVNYYDTYPQGTPAASANILGQTVLTDIQNVLGSTKSFPTATYIKNIDDDNWTKNYIWYDTKGRQIGSYTTNHLGGYTRTETLLNFAGAPQKINTYHARTEGAAAITIKERFIYDPQSRLKRHYHQVNSKPEELLSENTYNQLSQLTNKKVGNNLQNIDYAYNIRGWLAGINKDQMTVANLGGKLFSYNIKYTQKEGITNPDAALFSGKDVKAKFDGNITEVDWRAVETIGVNPSLTPKRYGYAYDKLNRLTAGYYQNPTNPYSREHTESLGYDLNGNITSLYRTSVLENANTTATVIDNLQYNYGTSGNRLLSVNDTTQNPFGYEGGGNAIFYDLNGNMDKMPDKGINAIHYNFLNLPDKIELGSPSLATITYKYNASGTKLQKSVPRTECGIVDCYTAMEISDYLDGFHYLQSIVIDGGSGPEIRSLSAETARAMEMQAFSVDEQKIFTPPTAKAPSLRFFPTSEGFYDYQNDQYIYQYKDHLGNVRVSFARNSAGVLEIKDANDYYPFGMNHLKTGNAFFGGLSFKNYKFLGKELQETGFYDLEARFYMPDLGRFNTHDPLSSLTLDPYGYAYGNPLFFTDVTGLRSDPINASGDPGGPGGDLSPNEPGGVNNPHQIQEIVLNAPIRAIASNPASVMPNSCGACYYNGGGMGINLPQSTAIPIPASFYKPVLNNGSAMMIGGAGDPFGIWEVLGIALSAGDSNYSLAALPLLVMTKNGDDALKLLAVEKEILKAEAKATSKAAVAENGTLTAGPFAGEGYPAVNGHSRKFTVEERKIINEQGSTFGCHTCGQTSSGTKSGNFILDHQPANALVPNGWPQTFYPHCKSCSASQGGIISGMKKQGILPKISK